MLPHTEIDPIKKAIEAAEQERAQLIEKLKEMDKIKERLGQVEAFISQGKILIGQQPSEILSKKIEDTDVRSIRFLRKKPNYEKIVEIFKTTGRAMKLSEISNEFRARQWPLSEKNPLEILRTALKSKPLLFVKIGRGAWDLKEQTK